MDANLRFIVPPPDHVLVFDDTPPFNMGRERTRPHRGNKIPLKKKKKYKNTNRTKIPFDLLKKKSVTRIDQKFHSIL